jgi:uncharacterized protein YkwD
MASGRVALGHQGFADRLAGVSPAPLAAAENVARLSSAGTAASAEILRRWSASPSHRANLLGPYGLTGIGVAFAPDGSLLATQIYASLP